MEWAEVSNDRRMIIASVQTKDIIRAFGIFDGAACPTSSPYFGYGQASERIFRVLAKQF
jgi:hypothetical protein